MKSLSKKMFFVLILGPVIMWIFLIWYSRTADVQKVSPDNQPPQTDELNINEEADAVDEKLIHYDVPFTTQAPFGNWDDIRQQNACEEASMLMAMLYVRGENMSPREAFEEILKIDSFEKETYGYHLDTSAQDTSQVIRDYFKYAKVEYQTNITLQSIKEQLMRGNLVIVPADGRKLGNPYFTAPGPETHMLLIIGYDPTRNEFITNDPGTKRGKDYKYNEDVLYNAIRDYPTGYHAPITSISKTMIIIETK